MNQNLALITLLVNDYDEAIGYYTQVMGFQLLEDKKLDDTKRWVLVKPKGDGSTALLLAKASNEGQSAHVGNQTGGRVFLFLHTDDFWRDYKNMSAAGVQFNEEPRNEAYGTVAVFEDYYGNLWDLLQLKEN